MRQTKDYSDLLLIYDSDETMNCNFCNQKLTDPTHQWQGPLVIAEFKCEPCRAQFTIELDPLTSETRLTHYEFLTDKYKLNFELDGPLFTIWSYQKTGVAAKFSLILNLNTIPNITPQNAPDKIPTLITFS